MLLLKKETQPAHSTSMHGPYMKNAVINSRDENGSDTDGYH
jgi:hypothetical protein